MQWIWKNTIFHELLRSRIFDAQILNDEKIYVLSTIRKTGWDAGSLGKQGLAGVLAFSEIRCMKPKCIGCIHHIFGSVAYDFLFHF